MNIYKNGCPFCNEFNGKVELSFFRQEYWEKSHINNRTLFQTKEFACVPPLGSFCEGYMLIVPRQHVLSMLALKPYLIHEYADLVKRVSLFYKQQYNKGIITFEHGSTSESNPGGMSVIHAHVHCVPYDESIVNDAYFQNLDLKCFPNYSALQDYWLQSDRTLPYLYFSDIDGKQYLYESRSIPSQIMRKIMCRRIRNDETWNWKEYPYIDNIIMTLAIAKHSSVFEV